MGWIDDLLAGLGPGLQTFGSGLSDLQRQRKLDEDRKRQDALDLISRRNQFQTTMASMADKGWTEGATVGEELQGVKSMGGVVGSAAGGLGDLLAKQSGGRSISMTDPEGKARTMRYDSALDPTLIAKREDHTARQQLARERGELAVGDAERKRLAQAASWRLANGKAQPGDEELADPTTLGAFTNTLADNRRGDDAQSSLNGYRQGMLDYKNEWMHTQGPNVVKPYKETDADRTGAAILSKEGGSWSLDERNAFGRMVSEIVAGGAHPKAANTAALRAMGKMRGGSANAPPRPGARASVLRAAAGMGGESAAPAPSTPPKGAAAAVMRRQSETVPMSGSNAQTPGGTADTGSSEVVKARILAIRKERDAYVKLHPQFEAQADAAMQEDLDALAASTGQSVKRR